jgi:hypothetical protein
MQFSPRVLHRRRRWHRFAGRGVLPAGLVAAVSALALTSFAPRSSVGDELLHAVRLTAGTGMAVSLVLGVTTIRRRDVAGHLAWMTRGYALGLGAATQMFTIGIGQAVFGRSDLTTALSQAAAWTINLAIAERAIRSRTRPRRPARRGPEVHPLALRTEQAEDLDRLVAGRPEPVGHAGVELGDLAGSELDVVVGDDEPQPSGEHVQPLVALVDPEVGLLAARRDHDLPGLDAAGLSGERHDDPAVAVLWSEADPRVADLGRADEIVERHLVGLGDRQQQFEARLPLTALESGQGALRDARGGRELGQRDAALVPQPSQPRTDLGEDGSEGRRFGHAPQPSTDSQYWQQKVAAFAKAVDAVDGGDPDVR